MKPGYAIWFVIVNNKDLVCPDNRILLSLLNYTQKMIKGQYLNILELIIWEEWQTFSHSE